MNNSLLACLAFHYVPDRIQYLVKVIETLTTEYKCPVHIIIDTNVAELPPECTLSGHPGIEVVSHLDLEHPFHLTCQHRIHFKERIDQYDAFGYFEDDHYLPYENYCAAIEKYDIMWPSWAPTFIRIEESEGKQYVSDVCKQQSIQQIGITRILDRFFTTFQFPFSYNGFWLMPKKYLKGNMIPSFIKMTDAREWSAMYPTWQLNKKSLVEIYEEDGKWFVHPNCYSYHLPNNYVGSPMGNATIEVKDILI